jgi:hypothetical protein
MLRCLHPPVLLRGQQAGQAPGGLPATGTREIGRQGLAAALSAATGQLAAALAQERLLEVGEVGVGCRLGVPNQLQRFL